MSHYAEEILVYCYTKSREEEFDTRSGNIHVRRFHATPSLCNRNVFCLPKRLKRIIGENIDQVSAAIMMGSSIPKNIPFAKLLTRVCTN
jgi:hypothetical protein